MGCGWVGGAIRGQSQRWHGARTVPRRRPSLRRNVNHQRDLPCVRVEVHGVPADVHQPLQGVETLGLASLGRDARVSAGQQQERGGGQQRRAAAHRRLTCPGGYELIVWGCTLKGVRAASCCSLINRPRQSGVGPVFGPNAALCSRVTDLTAGRNQVASATETGPLHPKPPTSARCNTAAAAAAQPEVRLRDGAL